jgi:hypothetical protein
MGLGFKTTMSKSTRLSFDENLNVIIPTIPLSGNNRRVTMMSWTRSTVSKRVCPYVKTLTALETTCVKHGKSPG